MHIVTEKGKGYAPAVKNKENWHYCAPFNIETGKPTVDFGGENYSDITAEFLLDKMAKDKKVVAITSAVPTSMGFDKARAIRRAVNLLMSALQRSTPLLLLPALPKTAASPFTALTALLFSALTIKLLKICASTASRQRLYFTALPFSA